MEEFIVFVGVFAVFILLGAFVHVPWFRWLVIIGVGLFIYFKWIYPRIQEKKEEQQFEKNRQWLLENQRQQEEAERLIRAKRDNIRSEMNVLRIFELDILPFLNEIEAQKGQEKTTISKCINDVKQQYSDNAKKATQLNAVAEDFDMSDRITIHSK